MAVLSIPAEEGQRLQLFYAGTAHVDMIALQTHNNKLGPNPGLQCYA